MNCDYMFRLELVIIKSFPDIFVILSMFNMKQTSADRSTASFDPLNQNSSSQVKLIHAA